MIIHIRCFCWGLNEVTKTKKWSPSFFDAFLCSGVNMEQLHYRRYTLPGSIVLSQAKDCSKGNLWKFERPKGILTRDLQVYGSFLKLTV